MTDKIELRVARIEREAGDVRRFVLAAANGTPLPPFTAGAHIDLQLTPNLSRSYSLMNSQDDHDSYELGIALDRESRGGSRYLFETVQVGDRIVASLPRNLFGLDEHAPHSVLIGGGIGITPLLSMAHRLKSLGRGWQLHCCTRSRETAAFLTDLEAFGRNVVLRFDDQHEAFLDLDGLINGAPAGSHFYCCGPKPMLTAFEAAVQRTGIAAARVHVESFKPVEDLGVTTELIVELARSGTSVTVPTGTTILEALRAAGISAQSSCESGICGECQVAVLDGIPDHRDAVLTDRERASNTTMMICCSGAKSSKLVLDL